LSSDLQKKRPLTKTINHCPQTFIQFQPQFRNPWIHWKLTEKCWRGIGRRGRRLSRGGSKGRRRGRSKIMIELSTLTSGNKFTERLKSYKMTRNRRKECKKEVSLEKALKKDRLSKTNGCNKSANLTKRDTTRERQSSFRDKQSRRNNFNPFLYREKRYLTSTVNCSMRTL